MTTTDTPFLNYRALLLGALMLTALSLGMIIVALLLDVQKATAPQLLTLSALWIAPGLFTGLKARDGRLLHGMVTGLAGALLLALLLNLMPAVAVLQQLAGDKSLVVIILGGLWGAIGGLFAEIIHLRRAKKGRR
ncbi:hypothetical protein [Sedimenticola thiotaurini]|uniref:Uncharacterized protein n=1 Tax=Sedimenticola thiotaurini TaxID=1543721 RepID=A0A0F7JXT2_9GAMM|nr:hypothetical protein [Sedimenticola thiotaurini]AKH20099.1 hypothetical protein AAY24_06725 [Sedimenticola thiotaurini]